MIAPSSAQQVGSKTRAGLAPSGNLSVNADFANLTSICW